MCCVEALGNGASRESRFNCFRFLRGGDWNGSVRVGDSQIGDSSMTIGVFAVPCSIERSMTSGREEAGHDTGECNPDSGESEMVTRPASVGEEWAAELRTEGLEGGTCPSSRVHPSWLCPVHYVSARKGQCIAGAPISTFAVLWPEPRGEEATWTWSSGCFTDSRSGKCEAPGVHSAPVCSTSV